MDKDSHFKLCSASVVVQVRYLGLVENMKVRRAGYPFRMKYEWFMKRLSSLSLTLSNSLPGVHSNNQQVQDALGSHLAQLCIE